MKLATLRNGLRDGRLVVVSTDARRCIDASPVAPTLLDALERWSVVEPALHDLARTVNAPAALGAMPFDARQCLAPLPRTWQWLDGSAFLNHGHLMERAFKVPSLRNVADRPPYMHAGQKATLAEVLAHYNAAPAAPSGHSELKPLGLAPSELRQLEAFLRALSGGLEVKEVAR